MPAMGPPTPQGEMQPGGFDFAKYHTMMAPHAPQQSYAALAGMQPKDEEWSTEPRPMMLGGKPTLVLVSKSGKIKPVDGSPMPKITQVNRGGKIDLVDENSVAPGTSLDVTNTPYQDESLGISRGNLGVSRAQLELAKQREKREADAAARGPAGTYDAERGVIVDPRAGTAQPVTVNGQPLGPKPNDKPPTEFQGKAQLFGSQMAAASKVIDTLEAKGVGTGMMSQYGLRNAGAEPSTLFGMTVPGSEIAPRLLTTTAQQQYNQAQRQWAESFLRIKTGAASTAQEVANNIKTFFPQPGDDAATVEQKRVMRKQAEADVMFASSGKRAQGGAAADMSDSELLRALNQ
jgi:hypothetical protein